MPNLSLAVRFPPDKQAEAQAYREWTDANWPGAPGVFAYLRPDIDGFWIVPYLGPPFALNGMAIAEPEGGPEMRADGELVSDVTWLEQDD